MHSLIILFSLVTLSGLTLSNVFGNSLENNRKFLRKLPQNDGSINQGETFNVIYTMGHRAPGDVLLYENFESFEYPAKKNVSLELNYPLKVNGRDAKKESEDILTYVEITCQQHTKEGNAYLVGGGIAQKYIQILLEALNTEHFSYSIQFYGKKF